MEQTKIWDYFQNHPDVEQCAFNAEARYRFIARQIPAHSTALNIGVGHGGLESALIERHVLVSSLDPSANAIDKLRERFAMGDRAKVGFAQAIPFTTGEFDFVVMSEVLEHLSDDVLHACLREVKRVLRPNGTFLGTVPADEVLLQSIVLCPDCGKPFHRWGHVQTFSRIQLGSFLSKQFSEVEISRHFFADLRTLNWKGKLVCSLKALLVRLGRKGANETFHFCAR